MYIYMCICNFKHGYIKSIVSQMTRASRKSFGLVWHLGHKLQPETSRSKRSILQSHSISSSCLIESHGKHHITSHGEGGCIP